MRKVQTLAKSQAIVDIEVNVVFLKMDTSFVIVTFVSSQRLYCHYIAYAVLSTQKMSASI